VEKYQDIAEMERQKIRKEAEKEKQKIIAKEMLKEGLNIDLIAKITKLSQKEIKDLQT